jgi:peptide chain release factor 1
VTAPSGRAPSLEARLADLERQFEDLQAQLATPTVAADPEAVRRLGRDLARLEPIVTTYRRLQAVRRDLEGARQIRDRDSDEALRALAREEVAALEEEESNLLRQLRILLLPRDPADERNVILEVRAGAGGEEAALFAADLLRMYLRYAERHGLRAEVVSLNETGIGGVREAIVTISGEGAYSRLKFEGGTHRVQRIPVTESAGRIHTSTATVVVMPEAEPADVVIDEDRDLRIEVKRSSGPGGQSVNTTDSAVRVTHLPTGLVVEIQDERSQLKNKAKALTILRARLLAMERARQREAESAIRRSMIGSGERAEKIRTYNVPQDRVTDHRIGKTVHNLAAVLDGELDELIDALATADQAERLQAMLAAEGDGSGVDEALPSGARR